MDWFFSFRSFLQLELKVVALQMDKKVRQPFGSFERATKSDWQPCNLSLSKYIPNLPSKSSLRGKIDFSNPFLILFPILLSYKHRTISFHEAVERILMPFRSMAVAAKWK